jgi:insulysin
MAVEPRASAQDENAYRVVTLENGLVALLVSDAEADKAAAALDVRVGYFSDPDEVPGLAHFCEHMLFLGTKKYPDETFFSAFLNAHGGHSNAFTGMESTNYYFDVNWQFLEPALDRFAQFFVGPLFTASATEREMRAVESENAKNLQNDLWRSTQLLHSVALPSHPMHKFGSGNLRTLRDAPRAAGIDVRQQLLSFYDKYYSSSVMKLAVLGRAPLDELEALVRAKFSEVRNSGRRAPEFPLSPYPQAALQTITYVLPVKQKRELTMFWPMPPLHPHFRSKPDMLLSHLFGHEAEGSILALLKRKNWASGLSAGPTNTCSCASLFAVSIALSEEGLSHVDETMAIVFEYGELLRAASSEVWREVFQETRDIAAMNFRFKGKEHPWSYCSSLASRLQTFPPADVLTGPALLEEFDEAKVRELLALITPANCMVQLAAKEFEGRVAEREPWYGTLHRREAFSAQLLEQLRSRERRHPELRVPSPNPFIPTDFSLRGPARVEDRRLPEYKAMVEADRSVPPALLAPGRFAGVTCFHKLDRTFNKPKAYVACSVISPAAYFSPLHTVLTDLYVRLLVDSLGEYTYDAELAGLYYSLFPTATGMQLLVYGYNHKLEVLARKLLERMRDLQINPERFKVHKSNLEEDLTNFDREQPYQHSHFSLLVALEHKRWHVHEKLAAMRMVSPAALQAHIAQLLSQVHLEMLIDGNVSEQDAEQLVALYNQVLLRGDPACVLPHHLIPDNRVVQLAHGRTYVYDSLGLNPNDVNSATLLYLQVGPDEVPVAARLQLLAQMLSEPSFDQLRTVEQLGYIVSTGQLLSRGVLGLTVLVQSSERPPAYLEERIEAFLEQFRETLAFMPEDDFLKHRDALAHRKLESVKTLSQQHERYWSEITRHRFLFDRQSREVAELRRVSLQDLLAFYNRHVAVTSSERRKFIVRFTGHRSTAPTPSAAGAAASAGLVLAAEEDADGEAEADAKEHADAEAVADEADGDTAGARHLEEGEDEKEGEAPGAAVSQQRAKAAAKLRAPPVERAARIEVRDLLMFSKTMPLFPNLE